jgi:hypothetical protein
MIASLNSANCSAQWGEWVLNNNSSAESLWSIFKHDYFYRHVLTNVDELHAGAYRHVTFYNSLGVTRRLATSVASTLRYF